jgi:hypothetical protein
MTLGISIKCHYADFCYGEHVVLFVIMLNVSMLSVVMLKVIVLSVVSPLEDTCRKTLFIMEPYFQPYADD